MVIDGYASLVISSKTRRLEDITALLGIEPTSYWELGDPHTWQMRDKPPESHPRRSSIWALHIHDVEFDHPEDETGLASLRRLADLLKGKGPILESLRPELDPTILWTGDSDSTQGGFYVPIDLVRDLSDLGCDIMMTVNNEEQKYKKKRKKARGQKPK